MTPLGGGPTSRYGRFTVGDWILCKQQLIQFFQGRKVRVSLFLQQQFQATDGTLSLDAGGPLQGRKRGLQCHFNL